MKNKVLHIVYRVSVLIGCFFLSFPLSKLYLTPKNKCGNGVLGTILLLLLIFYLIWGIILLIEAYRFHKSKNISYRNINILVVLIFIVAVGLFSL